MSVAKETAGGERTSSSVNMSLKPFPSVMVRHCNVVEGESEHEGGGLTRDAAASGLIPGGAPVRPMGSSVTELGGGKLSLP